MVWGKSIHVFFTIYRGGSWFVFQVICELTEGVLSKRAMAIGLPVRLQKRPYQNLFDALMVDV